MREDVYMYKPGTTKVKSEHVITAKCIKIYLRNLECFYKMASSQTILEWHNWKYSTVPHTIWTLQHNHESSKVSILYVRCEFHYQICTIFYCSLCEKKCAGLVNGF